MKKFLLTNLAFLFIFTLLIQAQVDKKDKGKFIERKPGFYQEVVLKGIKDYNEKEKETPNSFVVDLSNFNIPKSLDQFTQYWHNEPISQGNTGTCWSFSTTSFFESEVYRLHKKKVKLSELYTVYWEYVEKAKGFVEKRGESAFSEGSEANAVTRIWTKYGIVPEADYKGLMPGQKFHDHSKMYDEMNTYLESVKENNAWDEEEVVETIKSILNYYMGVPPVKVTIDGNEYTPKQYLNDVLQLNLDNYVDVLSLMEKPYGEQVEYPVHDNWWHSKDYYNVSLDVFMKIIKKAVREGYTICIGGDVSEPGKMGSADVAVIPTFDIPSQYIDQYSRQFRFTNKTTTDDHGIHIVGYMNDGGKDWYLIKDSGSSARDGKFKGYYFFQEDYVKLKIMDFMIHKDAVKGIIDLN